MSSKKGKEIVEDLKKYSEKGLAIAKQIILSEKMEPLELRRALEYYLCYWGDSTHTGLFAVACETVGGNIAENVNPQAAIALMTAAFDIHDDIIDKSKTKNKIPTVYGKYGQEIALLLGNAFLIEGLKLLADSTTAFPREKCMKILETTKKLLFDVGNAHALEICLKTKNGLNLKQYLRIAEMKAASIETDLMLGAIFGGGTEDETEILAKVGRILGELGTLREDLIDVFDIEELCQRIAVHDLPLPLQFAMQNKQGNRKINSILSKSNITKADVSKLVDLTLESHIVKEMKDRMQLLVDKELSLLDRLQSKKLPTRLQDVISFMLEDL